MSRESSSGPAGPAQLVPVRLELRTAQRKYAATPVLKLDPGERDARIFLLECLLRITHFDDQDAMRPEEALGFSQDPRYGIQPLRTAAQCQPGFAPILRRQ